MNKEEFINAVKNLKIELTSEMINQFDIYLNYLLEYNKATNLTAIRDENGVYLKHFFDSLTVAKYIGFSKECSLVDVGTGAGFPGIVLKIVFPQINLYLIDSNKKKTTFLEQVVSKLRLQNVTVVNDRVEIFALKSKKFDYVISRAMANMTALTEMCLPLAKVNGYFIAMKSNVTEELKESLYAINYLGGTIENTFYFELPVENSSRAIVVVKKINPSPQGYPRDYSRILKKPLKKN